MVLSKKSLKTLKRMAQGHGLYKMTLSFDGQQMDILFKLNNHNTKFITIYKDGNRFGKRKMKLYEDIVKELDGK